MSLRVICTGSREWTNPEGARLMVSSRLAELPSGTLIVVGYDPEKDTPKGVDRWVWHSANDLGLPTETHPAEWQKYGRGAGYRRNAEMAQLGGDLCLAFWNERDDSRGTLHMIEQAEKYGIPVELVG